MSKTPKSCDDRRPSLPPISSSNDCIYVEPYNTEQEDVSSSQYLIYYTFGDLFIRPAGLLTGEIKSEYTKTIPYILRRSNGEIRWMLLDKSNSSMLSDYHYVMETNVAPISTNNVMIVAGNGAKVYVYGESYKGFCFESDSVLELKGTLHIAKWKKEGMSEKCVDRNCIVDVTEGCLVAFICDFKEIVILSDNESKFCIKMIEDDANAHCDVLNEDLSDADETCPKQNQMTHCYHEPDNFSDKNYKEKTQSSFSKEIEKKTVQEDKDEKINPSKHAPYTESKYYQEKKPNHKKNSGQLKIKSETLEKGSKELKDKKSPVNIEKNLKIPVLRSLQVTATENSIEQLRELSQKCFSEQKDHQKIKSVGGQTNLERVFASEKSLKVKESEETKQKSKSATIRLVSTVNSFMTTEMLCKKTFEKSIGAKAKSVKRELIIKSAEKSKSSSSNKAKRNKSVKLKEPKSRIDSIVKSSKFSIKFSEVINKPKSTLSTKIKRNSTVEQKVKSRSQADSKVSGLKKVHDSDISMKTAASSVSFTDDKQNVFSGIQGVDRKSGIKSCKAKLLLNKSLSLEKDSRIAVIEHSLSIKKSVSSKDAKDEYSVLPEMKPIKKSPLAKKENDECSMSQDAKPIKESLLSKKENEECTVPPEMKPIKESLLSKKADKECTVPPEMKPIKESLLAKKVNEECRSPPEMKPIKESSHSKKENEECRVPPEMKPIKESSHSKKENEECRVPLEMKPIKESLLAKKENEECRVPPEIQPIKESSYSKKENEECRVPPEIKPIKESLLAKKESEECSVQPETKPAKEYILTKEVKEEQHNVQSEKKAVKSKTKGKKATKSCKVVSPKNSTASSKSTNSILSRASCNDAYASTVSVASKTSSKTVSAKESKIKAPKECFKVKKTKTFKHVKSTKMKKIKVPKKRPKSVKNFKLSKSKFNMKMDPTDMLSPSSTTSILKQIQSKRIMKSLLLVKSSKSMEAISKHLKSRKQKSKCRLSSSQESLNNNGKKRRQRAQSLSVKQQTYKVKARMQLSQLADDIIKHTVDKSGAGADNSSNTEVDNYVDKITKILYVLKCLSENTEDNISEELKTDMQQLELCINKLTTKGFQHSYKEILDLIKNINSILNKID